MSLSVYKNNSALLSGNEVLSMNSEDSWCATSNELYWYFGYGSNLNSDTFLGRRGVRPLKQIRLAVPGWILTFEIPGVPYSEPGFGSVRPKTKAESTDKRNKDLQGIAYLVTKADYLHIIATEGGDSAYKQIKIQALEPETGESYEVWTLQAREPRSGCQPSVRYLNIIKNGAKEHGFPEDYVQFLESFDPFELRTRRQRIGATIFLAFWLPIIMWIFALSRASELIQGIDRFGWLQKFSRLVFRTMWQIHDNVWSQRFGPGDHNIDHGTCV